MTMRVLTLWVAVVMTGILQAKAETVTVNSQKNVVNSVTGGGKVNSGVDLGKKDDKEDDLEAEPAKPEPKKAAPPSTKTTKKTAAKPKKSKPKVEPQVITGNDKITTVDRPATTRFTGLYVSGAFKVKVISGAPQASIKLTGDDNVLPVIATVIANNRLDIKTSKSFTVKQPLEIEVQVPHLGGIWLEGAVDATIEKISGDQFCCELVGASRLKLSGQIKMLRAQVDGVAKLNAAGLTADRVDLNAEGASQTLIHPIDKVKATATGAAKVFYIGKLATVHSKIGAAAVVKLANEEEIKEF